MGKLFDVPGTGVVVSVLTRDHCPAHVHCECVAESWEARIAFSYLGDRIELMDIVALKKIPRRATLNRLGEAVAANLKMCRREWWRIYTDLPGKPVAHRDGIRACACTQERPIPSEAGQECSVRCRPRNDHDPVRRRKYTADQVDG